MTPDPTTTHAHPAVEARHVVLRWTIARKLYLLVGLILALFLAVVLFTLYSSRLARHGILEMSEGGIPLLEAVMAVNDIQNEETAYLFEFLNKGLTNSADGQALLDLEGKLKEKRAPMLGQLSRAEDLMERLRGMQRGIDPKVERVGKQILELRRQYSIWDTGADRLVQELRGRRLESLPILIRDVRAAGQELGEHVHSAETNLFGLMQDAVGEVADAQGAVVTLGTAFGSVALVVGGLLGFVLVRRLNRPIASLTGAAQSIAAGDLGLSVIDVQTTDETAVLADAFNRMAGGLRAQIQETKRIIETLGTATAEISASIQEQAASSKEQAATIQEISTTMQEIRQSGGDIAARAGEVAKVAETGASASVAGLKAVEEGNRNMERIREQVEEVAEHIVALSEKNQAVGQIIASVTEIAEQSHMLAINAAIEAASAGEQGGRFSVVAAEMRNLANQAKESTVQVRTILGEVQKGINTSVMLAEEAVKRVESAKAQAEVTRHTIGELRASTEDSVQAFQQIIAGTHQQHIGVEQITQGMNDIRQAAQQTAAGISQLEQAMHNLVSLAHQLRHSVDRYRL